jgi:hypothetical protein
VLGKLFLVVADTTDLITDLRVESLLLGAKTLTTKTKPAPVGALTFDSIRCRCELLLGLHLFDG